MAEIICERLTGKATPTFINAAMQHGTDDYDPGEECGRWNNGRLMSYYHCRQAGTEFCDWECPYSRTDPSPAPVGQTLREGGQ